MLQPQGCLCRPEDAGDTLDSNICEQSAWVFRFRFLNPCSVRPADNSQGYITHITVQLAVYLPLWHACDHQFSSCFLSITALGAGGGAGVRNTEKAKGAYAHAIFNLTAGEKIYMLVGQKGESACDTVSVSCYLMCSVLICHKFFS